MDQDDGTKPTCLIVMGMAGSGKGHGVKIKTVYCIPSKLEQVQTENTMKLL